MNYKKCNHEKKEVTLWDYTVDLKTIQIHGMNTIVFDKEYQTEYHSFKEREKHFTKRSLLGLK